MSRLTHALAIVSTLTVRSGAMNSTNSIHIWSFERLGKKKKWSTKTMVRWILMTAKQ